MAAFARPDSYASDGCDDDRSNKLRGANFMTLMTTVCPTASWTHKLDSEKRQEHDFSNLLQEFGYALRREDEKMIEHLESELRRMYRDRRPQKERR